MNFNFNFNVLSVLTNTSTKNENEDSKSEFGILLFGLAVAGASIAFLRYVKNKKKQADELAAPETTPKIEGPEDFKKED